MLGNNADAFFTTPMRTSVLAGGNAAFATRVEQLVEELRAAGQERLPGDRRYANRRVSERDGIAISEEEWAGLRALA